MARGLRATIVAVLTAALIPVIALPAPAGAAVSQPPGLPWSFEQSGFAPRDVPAERLPMNTSTAIPLTDSGVHDADGVRMVLYEGRLYDHPWGQAAYGMQLLNAYRITSDARYLTKARAQAQRLIDTHVDSRGAWFFPHRYPMKRHGSAADAMPVPFYSAMAQGGALSFFVRMFETTGETAYRDDADAIFTSFTLPQADGQPWVVEVDANHHVWLEEWPKDSAPDWTYNGHTFANYGIYDYARLTGDARAIALFDGAATSTLQLAPTYRTPAWISRYCLAHRIYSTRYHRVHVEQLNELGWLTGDVRFFRWSDTFFTDFPTQLARGTVQLLPGTQVGYQFSATGAVTTRKTVAVPSATRVPIDERTRIRNLSGSWYHVTRGALAGYYVAEQPTRAYLLGTWFVLDYSPARRATIKAGTAVRLASTSSAGWITSWSSATPASDVVTTTSRRAIVHGRSMVLLDGGPYAGRWVATTQVLLD